MPDFLFHLLPSPQSFGIWVYWVLALFVLLEAIVFTSLLAPGAWAAVAGGMLAQRGALDLFDLAWFVAAGAILGGEISFHLGRLASRRSSAWRALAASPDADRAKGMLQRYGGFAMVVGRFLGPLSAFASFSAAMTGMRRRRYTVWNVVSALPYGLGLPVIGYFFDGALGVIGAAAPRIFGFGAAILLILGVMWMVFIRLRRASPMLAEVLKAIWSGLRKTPLVRWLIERHPKVFAFAAARIDTAQFLGLTATVLAALFLSILGVYLDSVHDFLGSSDVASTDMRVAHLLYALRDERLIAFFGWVTSLGGWEVITAMLVGATAALRLLRHDHLAIGLWLAAAGNQLTVTLLKGIFARPRSTLGYLTETSGSFPSGHAAAAVAVWGMLFYVAWRARLAPAVIAGLAAVTIVFLIGVSRIYLVQHYMSDVFNGYLVGGAWLIVGIAFCEWRRATLHRGTSRRRRLLSLGVVSLTIVAALHLASTHSRPLNAGAAAPAAIVSGPKAIFTSEAAPRGTETLAGDPRQPINLVVVAPDAQTISAAMRRAGWIAATTPGISVLSRALWAEWTGAPPPKPLVIPTFWNNRPNELGFAAPVDGTSGGPRLHARFWRTDYQTEDMPIFVGTLTSEDPIKWAIDDDRPAPAIKPVSAKLAALLSKLRTSGLTVQPVQYQTPRLAPDAAK